MIKPENWIRKNIKEMITIPATGSFFRVFRNRYWGIDDEDNLYFYRSLNSPQCNPNKKITEKLISNKAYPYTKVKFIKEVYILFDPFEFVNG